MVGGSSGAVDGNRCSRKVRSRLLLLLLLLSAWTSGFHRCPKAFFGLSIPITAVQFEKYGCIWNSHAGFDYEHSKQLASAIELRDDLFVRKDAPLRSRKQVAKLFPIRSNPRGVFFANERQFLVGINVGFDVLAASQNRRGAFQHGGLVVVGHNSFNGGSGLCGIRRVGNNEPVAMTVGL